MLGFRVWDVSWATSEADRRAAPPRRPTRIRFEGGRKVVIDPNPPFVPGAVRREYRLFAPYSGRGVWGAQLGAMWKPTAAGEPVWAVCDRCGAHGICEEPRHYSGIYCYPSVALLCEMYPTAGGWHMRPGDGDRAKVVGRVRLLGQVAQHCGQELRAEGCVLEELIVPNVFEHGETLASVVEELGVYGVPIEVRDPAEIWPRHAFSASASRKMHERLRDELRRGRTALEQSS